MYYFQIQRRLKCVVITVAVAAWSMYGLAYSNVDMDWRASTMLICLIAILKWWSQYLQLKKFVRKLHIYNDVRRVVG